MAWENRGRRQYYYRSLRQGDVVVKQFVGSGEAGRFAAEADQAARFARRQAAQLRRQRNAPVDELGALLDEFDQLVDELVTCELLCAGARQHRRQWRLPKNGRTRSHNRNT
jgi:hypothetical protein